MRRSAALLVVLVLAAGCTDLLFSAELDGDGFSPVLFGSVAFFETNLEDTPERRLHADVFLPADPLEVDAPTRFPTILVLSPYWGTGTQGQLLGYRPYDYLVEELVPRGYAVVYGDLVGSGGSSGCWDFMGPVERAGSVAMVEAIAAQPWSDGKVGMMGISYDGMTQIMAASDRAPHLVTVVPASPITHAYGGIMQNGVRYDGNWRAFSLVYERASLAPVGENPERAEGWQRRLAESPACIAENHATELTLDSYSPYYKARDYRALGANVTASVFYMQGLRDQLVKPDNFGDWFEGVPTLKKAWIGSWQHAYPDHVGRADFYATVHRWFDHTLKGVDNGIDREPRFDIMSTQGRWRTASEWPAGDAVALPLHLSADRALVLATPEAGVLVVGGPEALPGAIPGQTVRSTSFTSATFTHSVNVSGSPVLRLTLTSDRPVGQIIARLYDNGWRMTQGALDLTYRNGLESPEPILPGEPFDVQIVMYPAEHEILAGHALLLELTTHDPTSYYEDDLSGATLTVATGGASSLLLPTV